MKGLTELLPLGIGVAVIGGLTWLLFERDVGFAKWLLAGLLLAHGWVHLMFVFPTPEAASTTAGGLAYPFDMSRSWLIGNAGMDPGLVRAIGIGVMVATVAAFAAAALSTVGLVVPSSWWGALVVGAAMCSMVLLGVFFSPALLLGFGIDLALVWLVTASAWSPAAGGITGAAG